jgi:hypothetical protein
MSPWIRLFETPVAPKAAWLNRVGEDFPVVERFLIPTGRFADFLPCGRNPANACGWRVVPGNSDVLIAVCPENLCEPIKVSHADCAMLRVDMGLIAAALAKALGLTGSSTTDSNGGLLGWISPVQTARYPAFLSFSPCGESHFPLVQRFAERAVGPFVLVLPSRENIDTDLAGLLAGRHAMPVFMEEEIDFLQDGNLEAQDARNRLVEFALVRAGIKKEFKLPRFPTPTGANWADITITADNEHTLKFAAVVRTGMNTIDVTQTYTFENLGLMKDSKDGPVPTSDWDNFLLKIIRERRLVGGSPKEWNSLKTSKKRISRMLGELMGLDPRGAFTDHPGLRCYEAVFKVECERGQERQLPVPPRRLNRLGQVAKSDQDE